jgi:hypothetical protein
MDKLLILCLYSSGSLFVTNLISCNVLCNTNKAVESSYNSTCYHRSQSVNTSSNGSSKIETYWIKTSRYLYQHYPCNSTKRKKNYWFFNSDPFRETQKSHTFLPVSDSVPIAKMFSALTPEYFMTDSEHNMQLKDTDGFVTWVCNSHGYDVCCQWKHLRSRNYF